MTPQWASVARVPLSDRDRPRGFRTDSPTTAAGWAATWDWRPRPRWVERHQMRMPGGPSTGAFRRATTWQVVSGAETLRPSEAPPGRRAYGAGCQVAAACMRRLRSGIEGVGVKVPDRPLVPSREVKPDGRNHGREEGGDVHAVASGGSMLTIQRGRRHGRDDERGRCAEADRTGPGWICAEARRRQRWTSCPIRGKIDSATSL